MVNDSAKNSDGTTYRYTGTTKSDPSGKFQYLYIDGIKTYSDGSVATYKDGSRTQVKNILWNETYFQTNLLNKYHFDRARFTGTFDNSGNMLTGRWVTENGKVWVYKDGKVVLTN